MKNKEEWNPNTSKWKAALEKGLNANLTGSENVLYLGASSGTTVGQISKLTKGIVFAVENSPQMAIRLVKLAEKKENIAPIFSDARDTDFIQKAMFKEKADILFQDIPSTDQIRILTNASKLVDKKCRIFLSLKTQSISQKDFKETAKDAEKELKEYFEIVAQTDLFPFHKKHFFYVLKKK
ncbi:fibrillarin-like rRNA/tRNA 2'-O-methyltransferase [Candidatus Pacearchaeota archaeon]|nr:fibrillarin-like rRNA/tRNA 2'-O-methyltransferase [Candidatus Pacearchaeota archaeon]